MPSASPRRSSRTRSEDPEAEERSSPSSATSSSMLRVLASSHAAGIKPLTRRRRLDVAVALAEVAAENATSVSIFRLGRNRVMRPPSRHRKARSQDAQRFIPTSLLSPETQFIAVITGPNMGGNSTYCVSSAAYDPRANGIYIPRNPRCCPSSSSLHRIGAADNLARGRSNYGRDDETQSS